MTDPREELSAAARHFYGRGWMVGTAGNLSARAADGTVWITASGRAKGRLTLADFVRVDRRGRVLEPADARPSAETAIHLAVYERFEAAACYHVHSIPANLVSRYSDEPVLWLPPLEMLKGLGVMGEEPRVAIPVLRNHADVSRIASDLVAVPPPPVPAFLIRDHGLTTWAASTEAAFHNVELLEYIFAYMVEARRHS